MTNLTGDLVADITTLLQDRKNCETINDGQNEFIVDPDLWIRPADDRLAYGSSFMGLDHVGKLFFLRYCIKLLPAFRLTNWEYVSHKEMIDEMVMWDDAANRDKNEIMKNCYPTLSEALLKCGAMTLEELCEEYKRLVSIAPDAE